MPSNHSITNAVVQQPLTFFDVMETPPLSSWEEFLSTRQQPQPTTNSGGGSESLSSWVQSNPFDEAETNNENEDNFGDDMLVGDIFGRPADRSTLASHPMVVGTNRVGVEIELENITTNISRHSVYWQQIYDGSLRNNGAEFIFRGPFGGKDLFNAMVEIDTHLHKLNPDDSQRCSTHVHVDVRDMTVTQLKRMLLIYTVYERVLFQCSGWQRYRNNFCVALGFAQSMMKVLSRNWNRRDQDFLSQVTSQWDKYTAMNLLPISDKGSVEFRISEAKWRKGQLLRLCNRFLSLKELAMSFTGTNEELIEHLMIEDVSKVLRKSLPRNLPDVVNDVQLGAKLAYDILYVNSLPQREVSTNQGYLAPSTRIDGLVENSPDMVFITNLHAAAWEFIKSRVASRTSLTRRFGTLPDNQPHTMTFSFIYELCQNINGMDSMWFMTRDGEVRQQYRTYRNWVLGN